MYLSNGLFETHHLSAKTLFFIDIDNFMGR